MESDLARRDVLIVLATVVAVIGIDVVAVAGGFEERGVQAPGPDLTVSTDVVDLGATAPDSPGPTTSGQISFFDREFRDSLVIGNGTEIVAANLPDDDWGFVVADRDVQAVDQCNETADGATCTVSANGFEIDATLVDAGSGTWKFDVTEAPERGLSRRLASIGGWIVSTLLFTVLACLEVALDAVAIALQVIPLSIGLLVWTAATYLAVISSVGGIGSAVLAVPALVLGFEGLRATRALVASNGR